MKILFILLTTFIYGAIAKDCSYVNLTEEGKIFNAIPTYDQVGAQICFAYTAAQLIEGQRILQGHQYSPDEAVSPISLAISLALEKGETDLQQGGVACEAVEHFRKHGVCPVGKSFKTAEEALVYVDEYTNCQIGKYKACDQVKRLTGSRFNETMAKGNPLAYLRQVEASRCTPRDRIRLEIPGCNKVNNEAKTSAFFKAKVDKVFNSSEPRPIEIGYSMHLFSYDANAQKKYVIPRVTEPDVLNFSLKYKPHSSVLLGRRAGKNGSCQYLLRNTQGESYCPIGIAQKLGWECTRKGIWINEEELFDSTFQISHTEETKATRTLSNFIDNLLNSGPDPLNCE